TEKTVVMETDPSPTSESKSVLRNWIAFWFLGVCLNFGFHVMLAAAFDLLSKPVSGLQETDGIMNDAACHPTATAAILVADILPSFFIKLISPFIFSSTHLRMVLII